MNIVKKEDGLGFGGGIFTPAKKGTLVLTDDRLYFESKKDGKRLFDIAVRNILSVRAQFYKNQDALRLSYEQDGAEKKLDVWHRQPIGIMSLTGAIREPFFRPWETIIEQHRLTARSNRN